MHAVPQNTKIDSKCLHVTGIQTYKPMESENPKTNSHVLNQMNSNKDKRTQHWIKDSLVNKWCSGDLWIWGLTVTCNTNPFRCQFKSWLLHLQPAPGYCAWDSRGRWPTCLSPTHMGDPGGAPHSWPTQAQPLQPFRDWISRTRSLKCLSH